MALIHRGVEGSSVYVYQSDDGYWCDACILHPGCDSALLDTAGKMIEHLRRHREAGHIVPERVFEELMRRSRR